jgi:hypothetical protein
MVNKEAQSEKRRARGPRARAVIPIMMWIPKRGALGDRALQPLALAFLFTHCSSLVANKKALSLFIAYLFVLDKMITYK